MTAAESEHDGGETRRDFLIVATTTIASVGGVASLWPLLDSLNPAADTLSEHGSYFTTRWGPRPKSI